MLEMVRMNGLFIPLQKGAGNSREFWGKIPGYPGFFVHAEKPGITGLWKSLKSQEDIFHAFQFFPTCKKAWKRQESREPRSFLGSLGFSGFFWKGPGQSVFLDSILTNICLIKFIVMCSKLVLFFSERKK